jgi:hypothetical protein
MKRSREIDNILDKFRSVKERTLSHIPTRTYRKHFLKNVSYPPLMRFMTPSPDSSKTSSNASSPKALKKQYKTYNTNKKAIESLSKGRFNIIDNSIDYSPYISSMVGAEELENVPKYADEELYEFFNFGIRIWRRSKRSKGPRKNRINKKPSRCSRRRNSRRRLFANKVFFTKIKC